MAYAGEFELPTMLAIARLGDGAYGETVLDELEAKTSRTVTLGAVYKTLGRLESKGLVSVTVAPPTGERGGRRKKLYRLTADGRAVVRSSLWDLRRLAEGLREIRSCMKRAPGGSPGPPACAFCCACWCRLEEREFYLGDLEECRSRPWLCEIGAAAALRFSRRRRRSRVRGAVRRADVVSVLATDVRIGGRRLVRTPASTLTALTALSVGIGLSALMFSLISGGMLPTLPFEGGERIVQVRRVEFAHLSGRRVHVLA